MNNVKRIRLQIGDSQAEFARAIGCTQPNIVFYEAQTQDPPVDRGRQIIQYAAAKGVVLTLDDVYRSPELAKAGEAA